MKKTLLSLGILSSFAFASMLASCKSVTDISTEISNAKNEILFVSLANDSASNQLAFKSALSGLGGAIEQSFPLTLKGFSVSLPANKAQALAKVSGVTAVFPNNHYLAPTAAEQEAAALQFENDTRETISSLGEEAKTQGKGISIGILDTGLFYNQVAASADDTSSKAFRPLADATGAAFDEKAIEDKLPSLFGKTGKYVNSKIVYEYDYADNDSIVEPKEGFEHGTHVASLAAGNGAEFTGVAPNAQLGILKVFSDASSGASTATIITALEDAAKIGFDVINMSLGTGLLENPDLKKSAEFVAIANLQNQGTIVNIAAGNDGREAYSSVYGNTTSVTQTETSEMGVTALMGLGNIVASSTLNKVTGDGFVIDGKSIRYQDMAKNLKFADLFSGQSNQDYYYVPGDGSLESIQGKVEGKIAVVDRGGITFADKVANAEKAKAKGLIVIDNVNESAAPASGLDSTIPVAWVNLPDKGNFVANTDGKTLSWASGLSFDNPLAHQVSDFSSDGGTTNLEIGPDIAAPGSNVLGAVNGHYETMSGTSMATPNLSGAIATILSSKKEALKDSFQADTDYAAFKKDLTARLQSTADLLTDGTQEEGDSLNYASPRKQGAGQINVSKAIQSAVYLEGYDANGSLSGKAKIEFGNSNLISQGIIQPTFDIINQTKDYSAVKYKAKLYVAVPEVEKPLTEAQYGNLTPLGQSLISHKLVDTDMVTSQDHLIGVREFPEEITANTGSNNQVTLPATDVTTYFATDEGNPWDYVTEHFPYGTYVEGYVVLTPVEGQDASVLPLSLPYFGYAGDYGEAPAAEPFDFEKDPNEAYGSDTVKPVVGAYTGRTDFDFGSYIYGATDLGDVGTLADNIISGSATPESLGAVKVGEDGKIVAGVPHKSDQLLIQEFMNRTALQGSVQILGSDGTVLAKEALISTPYRGVYESEGYAGMLFKSFATESALQSGFGAGLTYGKIGLYDQQTGDPLKDGDYTLRFNYVLAAKDASGNNIVQNKDVPLTIESNPISSIAAKVQDDGSIRFFLDPRARKVTTANGSYAVDENGEVVLPATEAATGFVSFTVKSIDGSQESGLLDVRNGGDYLILGDNISSGDFYSVKADGNRYEVSVFNAEGKLDLGYYAKPHGYVLNVANLSSVSRVYVDLGNGVTQVLFENQYSYDASTQTITILGLQGQELGIIVE